jgi:hypothetical protein
MVLDDETRNQLVSAFKKLIAKELKGDEVAYTFCADPKNSRLTSFVDNALIDYPKECEEIIADIKKV